jgi:hypothetical protein
MVRRDTPEGLAKAAILEYLHVRDFFAWNNPTGAVEVRPKQWIRFGRRYKNPSIRTRKALERAGLPRTWFPLSGAFAA